jgi:hypothetical protein
MRHGLGGTTLAVRALEIKLTKQSTKKKLTAVESIRPFSISSTNGPDQTQTLVYLYKIYLLQSPPRTLSRLKP